MTPRHQRASAVAFALSMAVWLLACHIFAAPSRVAVVTSARGPAAAAAHLVGELRAAGLEIVLIERDMALSPRAQVELSRRDAFATVLVIATGSAIDIWIGDHLTSKTSVRRIRGSSDVRTLALRAVELLRASLLELDERRLPHDVRRFRGQSAPPIWENATPTFEAPPARRTRRKAWLRRPTVSLSPSLMLSRGFGAGLAVTLTLSYPLPVWALSARVGITPVIFPAQQGDSKSGTVALPQQLFLFELLRPVGSGVIVPLIGVGGGLYHVRAERRGTAARALSGEDRYAAAVGPSVGIAVRLTPRLALLADGHVLLVAPEPQLTIGSSRQEAAGQPLGRFGLGVQGAF